MISMSCQAYKQLGNNSYQIMRQFCNVNPNLLQFKKTETCFRRRNRSQTRQKVRLAHNTNRLPKDFFNPYPIDINQNTMCPSRRLKTGESHQKFYNRKQPILLNQFCDTQPTQQGLVTPAFRMQNSVKHDYKSSNHPKPFFSRNNIPQPTLKFAMSQQGGRQISAEGKRLSTLPVAQSARLYLSRQQIYRTYNLREKPNSHRLYQPEPYKDSKERLLKCSLYNDEKNILSEGQQRQQIKFRNKLTIDIDSGVQTLDSPNVNSQLHTNFQLHTNVNCKTIALHQNKIRKNVSKMFNDAHNGDEALQFCERSSQTIPRVRKVKSKPNKLPPLTLNDCQ